MTNYKDRTNVLSATAIAWWSLAAYTMEAIVPLSAGDVVQFLISFSGMTGGGAISGLGFFNGTHTGTPVGFTFTGPSNFIQGYRIS